MSPPPHPPSDYAFSPSDSVIRSLARDRSGAVMMMAVFMAVFLTGLLYYAIGLGNAIIVRETMLDGADATTFAASVYEARGMNLIAMINLIMAAVMAVLVMAKIVQTATIAATAVACITVVGCPEAADVLADVTSVVNDIKTAVDDIEPVLHTAATGVADAMPAAAMVRSALMATTYKPVVQAGGALPGKMTLPVQDDDPKVLCDAAATVIDELMTSSTSSIPGIGSVMSVAGGLTNTMVSTVPGWFCGEGGVDASALTKGATSSLVNQSCSQANITQNNQQCPKTTSTCTNYSSTSACKTAMQKKLGGATSGSSGTTSNMSTKRLCDNCNMGDQNFSDTSLVYGNGPGSGPDRGVDLAAWGKKKTAAPAELSKISFAASEFYFDIGSGDFTFQQGGDGTTPQQIPDDAMWNMRWRARLRRMHNSVADMGSSLGAIASSIESLQSLPIVGQLVGNATQGVTNTLGTTTTTVVH